MSQRKTRTNKKGEEKARLNVWIDAQTLENCELIAKMTKRNVSQIVEFALDITLDELVRDSAKIAMNKINLNQK